MDFAFCTIAAGNFAAQARVLAASCQHWHPEIPFYLLLLGFPEQLELEKLPSAGPSASHPGGGSRLLGMEEVAGDDLPAMLERYDAKQMASALKPRLLRKLLEQGYQAVAYIDADMWMLGRMDDVWDEIRQHGFSAAPHTRRSSMAEGGSRFERELLRVGIYNGGLLGATAAADTIRFLGWWEERLRTGCVEALREGLHYDQRWLDFAPSFVEDFHVLRDEGVNAAYWNAAELAPDKRLRLVHFSGYEPEKAEWATKYRQGLAVADTGPLAPLFAAYAERLWAEGYAEMMRRTWPWGESQSFAARCWRQTRRLAASIFGAALGGRGFVG